MARFMLRKAAVLVVGWFAVLVLVVGGDGVHATGAGEIDKLRDLFDQIMHSLAGKYFPGYWIGGADSVQLQLSVHPLPRRDIEKRHSSYANSILNPTSGNANNSDQDGDMPLGSSSPAGLANAPGGSAIPASVITDAPSPSQTGVSSQSNTPQSSASGQTSATASLDRSMTTSSPLSTPAASTTSPSVPLSKLITSNASPIVSSPVSAASTTTSTSSATPTKDSQKSDSPTRASSPSLLNPKHKLFPLIIAGLACAGLLAIMFLIAIARTIAHDQLRRDNLKKSYSFSDTPPSESKKCPAGDRFTAAPSTIGAARNLRRAMTKKKLGSFARRTQDGGVLIEVGDEVFAVPPHLAESYREKILREKPSRSELTAAGGLFGNVKPRYLNDGGPDGGDEEQARVAYDNMLDGSANAAGVGRSVSQRITDRLRSLTTTAKQPESQIRPTMVERSAYSFNTEDQQSGAIRQANLTTQHAVVTRGGAGWEIHPSTPQTLPPQHPHKPPPPLSNDRFGTARIYERTSSTVISQPSNKVKVQPRKAPPKLELTLLTQKLHDLEKQSCTSSASSHQMPERRKTGRLPKEASLTHSSTDGSSSGASANGTFGGSMSSSDISTSRPDAFPTRTDSIHPSTRRARSIKPLTLTIDPPSMGGYRHRQPETRPIHSKTTTTNTKNSTLERKSTIAASVNLASPTRFTHEKHARLVVHPEHPQPTACPFRPLPVPPPFTLAK